MIASLKKYFIDNIIINEIPSNFQDYEWYTNDTGDIIGIEKIALSKEQNQLLAVFLQPLDSSFLTYSKEDSMWAKFLFYGQSSLVNDLPKKKVRLTQLYLSEPCIDKDEFESILVTCFPNYSKIIWKNHHYAIIIEFEPFTKPDKNQFRAFVDSAATDFYTDVYFFIGIRNECNEDLLLAYQFEESAFYHMKATRSKKPFFTMQDALPLLISENLPTSLMKPVHSLFLQELKEDGELQKIFTSLFENNLNVSHTAKELFLHRNTLLYKIDKFHEKTGFDVRLFSHALTVYLSIYHMNNETDSTKLTLSN